MMDGGDWFWGVLMMFVFWAGLVAAVVVGFRLSVNPRRGPEDPNANATTILRNRYARGEISEEEFDQRTRVLERPPR